jgi:hypothetical protein
MDTFHIISSAIKDIPSKIGGQIFTESRCSIIFGSSSPTTLPLDPNLNITDNATMYSQSYFIELADFFLVGRPEANVHISRRCSYTLFLGDDEKFGSTR